EESRIAAVIVEAAIPVSPAARAIDDGRTPLDHALADGEDFELLFTVSPADGQKLLRAPLFNTPLTHIGEIVAGARCQPTLPDGPLKPLAALGWKHAFES